MIVKRSNTEEVFDINKVKKCTEAACVGLKNVSSDELIESALSYVESAKNTAEIQQILIQTAVDKIDIDKPDWSFVAARIFLFDLYHRVNRNSGYPSLRDYLTKGISRLRIESQFIEKYDLDLLDEYIKPERDFQFSYLGIRTLYDRYLLKDINSEPIELPQHMFMAIAMYLAQNEKEAKRNQIAIDFYNVLSKFEFMVATPTLSNARTPRPQLSSCYVGSCEDNIEDIFDCYKDMALLSKHGGGIGWDYSRIRALGSSISNHPNAAGGIIPFLKIANDVAVAIDQLGTRKGAIAVYIEIWHKEVLEFIDLRKNSGDERRRAHDLFTGLWVCDLFMQRLQEDKDWTLFDPLDCKDLTNRYGLKFERRYTQYEEELIARNKAIQIPARELWKKVLTSCFETGLPFICFKDNANKANPNSHIGIIRSSNLCTEIFQNTSPRGCDNNLGLVAVCNLGSINLSKVNTDEDLKRVIPIAVRMLDNVIDLNMYPIKSAEVTNECTRAIGLGIMGEAEMIASKKIHWASKEHIQCLERIMESFSYYTILSSVRLAKEKGIYFGFKGSKWQKGVLPADHYLKTYGVINKRKYREQHDWDFLKAEIGLYGIRNGYLMAIAPTSSISILTNTTQSIEPIYKLKWYEENLSGLIPVTVPNLNLDTIEYYKPAYSSVLDIH
nr:PREDICTED: uncharacterized protein LOC109439651 [Rhinolophus sinicus]